MKLSATVDILNRLAQASGFGSRSRLHKPCRGVLQVRNRADGRHVLVLSTNKEIGAQEYDVRSIQNFRTQFIKEGRATIEVREPPMSIMLRDCSPKELQDFIDGLRQLRENKTAKIGLLKEGNNKDGGTASSQAEQEQTPGTLRKNVSLKRPRSPELSKREVSKIKKTLSRAETVISVKDRANYPKEFPSKIETIKINQIRLRRIDKRWMQLNWLSQLDLSGNLLMKVEELRHLTGNLKFLDLSKNKISRLSDEFFDAPSLRTLVHLNLSENQLSRIPSSTMRLFMITHLNVSKNEIVYLPYNWMDLKNLRALNVADNKLLFLPATVLNLKNLQTLDVGYNLTLQTTTDLTPDYFGYSTLPTLFESAAEGLMNVQRRERLETDEKLPAIIKSYLKAGKYCIGCNKLCLRFKINKENLSPRSLAGNTGREIASSASLKHCLVKQIICFKCDGTKTFPNRIIF